MVLPALVHRRVHAHATYPDVFIFQYDTPALGVPDNFRDTLERGLGFGRRYRRSGLWADYVGPSGLPVAIKVHSVHGAHLRFTLKVRVLRGLHAGSSWPTTETYPPGKTNWLKSPDIALDNRHIWRLADEAIIDVQRHCDIVFDHVLEQGRGASGYVNPNFILPASSRTSLLNVEFTYDAAAEHPRAVVMEMIDEIRLLGAEVERFDYDPPLRIRSGAGGLMVTVKLHSGARLKLYSKTNRRVRAELQVNSAALRKLCPELCERRQPLRISSEIPFSRIFGVAVPEFVALTNTLFDRWRGARAFDDRTAFDLIAGVRACIRDDGRARHIIDQLVTDQRIAPSVGQHAIRRLRSEGIIERGVWGVHPIAREFRRAAELLASTPGFFSPSGVQAR